MAYDTKDSGKRLQYETGAQRDSENSKPRYDLIPIEPLKRLAELYQRGADKYDDDNWRKGIPLKRYYGSLFRHLQQWAAGEIEEDHLAAVAWNAFSIMWTEDAIQRGKRPLSLANFGPLAEDQPQDEDNQKHVDHKEPPSMSLGQKAFEAYHKENAPSDTKPHWDWLSKQQQRGWEYAAKVIVASFTELPSPRK